MTMWLMLSVLLSVAGSGETPVGRPGLLFVNTQFENASPLYWESDANNVVHIYLVYDQERSAPNRANGHWFFELQTTPNAELTLILHNFDNIWNGRKGSPLIERTACFVSEDAKTWRPIPTEKTKDNSLKVVVTVPTGRLYVARLEPYRLSDLEAFKQEIRGDARVEMTTIGRTVDGRELEIIRIGRANAAHRVLLRARAHPWEAGGNWVVHGLIQRLLRDDAEAKRYLETYCVYIMPMANKDGVVRGRTRFNMLGADLNRQWDKPPEPAVNPENHALETWLRAMVAKGQAPHLMIDLHNDESGGLHISRPPGNFPEYLAHMQRFDMMLRRYTWFTERTTGANVRNPGDIGEGLLARIGVDACVLELNANWIAGLNAYPSGARWQLFGVQLCETFYHYFAADDAAK